MLIKTVLILLGSGLLLNCIFLLFICAGRQIQQKVDAASGMAPGKESHKDAGSQGKKGITQRPNPKSGIEKDKHT